MMTDSLSGMLIHSVLIGSTTGVIGMYLSYILNIASGAAIVLFSALLFCLSLLLKPVRKKRILRKRFQYHGR
jgi:manganese/iron transport system permease protein/iron/zinc/copper transport system permease protein